MKKESNVQSMHRYSKEGRKAHEKSQMENIYYLREQECK